MILLRIQGDVVLYKSLDRECVGGGGGGGCCLKVVKLWLLSRQDGLRMVSSRFVPVQRVDCPSRQSGSEGSLNIWMLDV